MILALLLQALTATADPSVAYGARHVQVPLYRPWPEASKVFVEARLPDGDTALFLVDTGADTSVITRELAEALSLPLQADAGRVAGLGAEATVDLATLPWVRLGDVTIPRVDVVVDVPGHTDRWGAMETAGILGNNVWQRFVLELDLRADRLDLWTPDARKAPRGARPLEVIDGHPYTPVSLVTTAAPDQPDTVSLMIDTGANGVILRGRDGLGRERTYTEGVEALYGLGAATNLPTAAFLRTTRRIPLDAVVLGGTRVALELDARWIDYDVPATEGVLPIRGLVGHQALDGHRLLLDQPHERVLLRRSRRRPAFHDGHDLLLARELEVHGETTERALVRARYHLGARRPAEALRLLDLATREGPSEERAEARLLAARVAAEQGDLIGAQRRLTGLTPREAVRLGAVVAVVNSLLLDGDAEVAAVWLEEARVRSESTADLWVATADLHLHLGEHDLARAALSAAASLLDDPDAFPLRRARLAVARGDHDGALAVLRAAARANPLDGRPLWAWARLARPADLALLRADLARATASLHPGTQPLDFLVGAWDLAGDPQRARDLMEQGVARDCAPLDDAERANCEAWYWTLAGVRLDEALAGVERAIAADGARAAFLDTRAMVHLARGEVEAARRDAVRAARLAPEDPYMLWQASLLDALAARSPE